MSSPHFRPALSSPSYPRSPLFSIMDFELYPTVTLRSRSFNILQAPLEMFIKALNSHLDLQRFKTLYISGNYSAILSKLDRRFEALEIRRAFTCFQLMTILEEALLDHHRRARPLLYEDAAGMVEYVSHALADAAKEAAVLLYAPGLDPS